MTEQYQQNDINRAVFHTEQAFVNAPGGALVSPGRFIFGVTGVGDLAVDPTVGQFIRNFGVGGRMVKVYFQNRSALVAGDMTITLTATPPPGPQRTIFSATFQAGPGVGSRFLFALPDEGQFVNDEDLEWSFSFAPPIPTSGVFTMRPFYMLNEA